MLIAMKSKQATHSYGIPLTNPCMTIAVYTRNSSNDAARKKFLNHSLPYLMNIQLLILYYEISDVSVYLLAYILCFSGN